MASPFPRANAALDYPLYAVEFDPQDADRVVVSGGGGAGRSGVGNKITVLETSTKKELRVAGEIELSRDEDSVMSLAVGATKGKTTYLYAGVNSSPAEIAKGKNEHLRTLAIEQPRQRSSSGAKLPEAKIAEVSRAALFTDLDADTYQRVLRVAGNMGVAATAMGKEPQLVIFETGGASKPKVRGVLELPSEVEGLDIIDKGNGEHQVVYTFKYEVYTFNIGKQVTEPELVFSIPENETVRPQYKAMRYLSPNFVLAIANLGRAGAILQGLRLPTAGQEKARMAVTARLPKNLTATSLAVANLSPPASFSSPLGTTQFVVGVARQDSSLNLYTLDHNAMANIDVLANLHPFYTLKDVHDGANISGLAFSPFTAPKTHVRPQFIKLASISLQKTVAVHSIALKKFHDKTPRNKKGPPRPVRYVIEMKSKGPSQQAVVVFLTVMVVILGVIGQGIMEMFGQSPPILGVHKILPSWHGTLRTPDFQPPVFHHHEFVKKFAGDRKPELGEQLILWETEHPYFDPVGTDAESAEQQGGEQSGEEGEQLTVRKIRIDSHDAEVHGPSKTWDELPQEQRDAWKDRLYEAGAWTQNMGESVFKGILFGELAGAVGRAVGG